MMPKEKAIELVDKYFRPNKNIHKYKISIMDAKNYALIAVDEILNTIEQIFETFEERKYWQEVKQEIENL